eukprot:CAMPEP_0179275864 /NCGR_PEP_ID=MMETSP0797-20121207/34284_1 /TAXON_ID=47934 /ORGANISM="Dinophysis acuminata, Strain DAEP01" /LENGTH=37 /DNA_ID= /DNA_START= /DNA_END= /DNA_ORIENTATION=
MARPVMCLTSTRGAGQLQAPLDMHDVARVKVAPWPSG